VPPFLHSNPYFLPKVRMDRDRGEVWPGIFIKKFQSGFPRFDHSRPLLNTLLVNKLWRPVGYFPRKGPASLSPNSRKSNGATFRSKLNDDFVFVHGVPQIVRVYLTPTERRSVVRQGSGRSDCLQYR
jgi:hypothetical protein